MQRQRLGEALPCIDRGREWLVQLLHWSDHARIEASSRGQEVETKIIPLPVMRMTDYGKSSRDRAA